MKLNTICTLVIGLGFSAMTFAADAPPAPSAEDQAMMAAFEKMGRVGEQHQQLAAFVGKWSYVNTMWMDPKAEPMVSTGTAEAVSVWGGRYIETNFHGEAFGQPFDGRSLAGFDNLKGKYVATWIDSMSTGVFIAYGDHDAANKTTTYRGEMDDPMHPGKITPVREVVRWTDANHYVFEWYETHDGKENKTMEIAYTRM